MTSHGRNERNLLFFWPSVLVTLPPAFMLVSVASGVGCSVTCSVGVPQHPARSWTSSIAMSDDGLAVTVALKMT